MQLNYYRTFILFVLPLFYQSYSKGILIPWRIWCIFRENSLPILHYFGFYKRIWHAVLHILWLHKSMVDLWRNGGSTKVVYYFVTYLLQRLLYHHLLVQKQSQQEPIGPEVRLFLGPPSDPLSPPCFVKEIYVTGSPWFKITKKAF